MNLGRVLPIAATAALLWVVALPGAAAASTEPEASPPPCDLPTSTVVAGTPLVLTGPATSSTAVGVMARSELGSFREGAVIVSDGRWRAVVVFGAEDRGSWTIDVAVDGVNCLSPLTVTLPPGVVAPPRPTDDLEAVDAAPRVVNGSDVLAAAALTFAAVVLGSYVVLATVSVAAVLGARPMRVRAVRVATRVGTFFAVLGTLVGVASFVALVYSIAHFDSGLSSVESAVLTIVMWLVVVAGSGLGVVAARRVAIGPPPVTDPGEGS